MLPVFRNQEPHPRWKGNFFVWRATFRAPRWQVRQNPTFAPPPARVESPGLKVTFIGHATTLIQTNGLNFLTDPVWSDRVMDFRRYRAPGLAIEQLPALDGVLISHNHFDHLDIPTLKALQQRQPKLRFYAGLGNRDLFHRHGFELTEMNWWNGMELRNDVRLTFVPARHQSRRTLWDHNRSLWGGFLIQNAWESVYFTGDTGFGRHFEEIAKTCKPIRLAILPIGAYAPQWFWGPFHMSPEEAVTAHRQLRARHSLAVHFGTFRLTNEAQDEPSRRLTKACDAAEKRTFRVLEHGEGWDVPV